MGNLLSIVWGWIAALPDLVLSLFATSGTEHHLRPWLRWTLRIVIIVGVLVGLGFLNYFLDLEIILQSPWPLLRKIWLPLLFVLLCWLAWLGRRLWLLLQLAPAGAACPDIETAWREAVQGLNRAGIDVTEVPVFLLLGQPRGGEEHLFTAAHLPLAVRYLPRREDAPLHVYANRQAVFVTCAGASLLGRQAALLAQPGSSADVTVGLTTDSLAGGSVERRTLTLSRVSSEAPEPEGAVATEEPPAVEPTPLPRTPLLKNTDEVEQLTARLAYLCQLIQQDRRPFCPLNGVLLLLPWAALASDSEAQQMGRVCQRDLQTLQEALQVRCPAFVLVCDLEYEEGGREVIARLPERQRLFRLGLSFPLAPDLEAAQLPDMLESGVRWICDTQVPTLIYKLLRLEPGTAAEPALLTGNIRLYQLLYQLRERRERLGRLLSHALLRPALALGGCFLAASGAEAATEQAFVAGVFPLLVQSQNAVAWTPEMLAEEATFHRWTVLGYLGLCLLSIALVALVWLL